MQAKSSTVPAEPYPFELRPAECALLIIDMQRDFLEPGGFGEMLGNDVAQLRRTIEPNRRLLRPGAPPASGRCIPARAIGPTCRICRRPRRCAAAARPRSAIRVRWGAFWCAASPATTSFPSSIPQPGEPVIDKPGKGAFYATDLRVDPAESRHHPARRHRRHHRSVRQHHGARGQRPRLRLLRARRIAWVPTFPNSSDMGLRMIKAQGGIFGWVGNSADIVAAIGGG